MTSEILMIVFIAALIGSIALLIIALTLVPAINQLRSVLKELEKTSNEFRELTIRLKILSEKVDRDVDKFDAVLDASKETVETVSGAVKYIDRNVLKKSAGFLALIPAIKFGWDLVKKYRGGKKDE